MGNAPPASTPAPSGLETSAADVALHEYESSDPLDLSDAAVRMLHQQINGGDNRQGSRIKLQYDRDGKAILTATQYVGVVSLTDGPTVQITPKAADTNLLFLLRYAHGSTATTFDKRTAFEEGPTFLDALGTLFEAELDRLLNRGLHTDYRRTEGTEQQLRGQLDMQRQLQRQPPKPTKFECRYDELTHDIVANRAVLYAATLLLGLVADEQVTRQLRAHQQTMRRQVELTPITVADIDALHLDRLAAHYTDILRLARLVIANGFVGELQAGPSTALAMLVNMNTVYENAVERAFREAVANRTGWVVKGQDETKSLITRGGIDVTLRPDVVVNDATGATRVVADAKWKTKTPPNSDYYQMTSYMLDRDASGLLVYPDCGGANAAALEVANRFDLTLCELPTAADVDSYSAFTDGFVAAAEDAISALL